MTWYNIPIDTNSSNYSGDQEKSDICLYACIDAPHNLKATTLRCMAYLGLWDYLDNFEQVTDSDFDGVLFHAQEDSEHGDDLIGFWGSFGSISGGLLDGMTYYFLPRHQKKGDSTKLPAIPTAERMETELPSFIVTTAIFESLYNFLVSNGFCREIYSDYLDGENEDLHTLLLFLLDKVEQGHVEFNYDWISEFDTKGK